MCFRVWGVTCVCVRPWLPKENVSKVGVLIWGGFLTSFYFDFDVKKD